MAMPGYSRYGTGAAEWSYSISDFEEVQTTQNRGQGGGGGGRDSDHTPTILSLSSLLADFEMYCILLYYILVCSRSHIPLCYVKIILRF